MILDSGAIGRVLQVLNVHTIGINSASEMTN